MRAAEELTYKTNSFVLSAALLHQPDTLTLNLQDLANGVVYCREYQESEIGGGEINRAIELEDIFHTFKTQRPDEYTLGTVIKNEGASSSFSVNPGGEIIIVNYVTVKDQIRSYSSALKLTKMREMGERTAPAHDNLGKEQN